MVPPSSPCCPALMQGPATLPSHSSPGPSTWDTFANLVFTTLACLKGARQVCGRMSFNFPFSHVFSQFDWDYRVLGRVPQMCSLVQFFTFCLGSEKDTISQVAVAPTSSWGGICQVPPWGRDNFPCPHSIHEQSQSPPLDRPQTICGCQLCTGVCIWGIQRKPCEQPSPASSDLRCVHLSMHFTCSNYDMGTLTLIFYFPRSFWIEFLEFVRKSCPFSIFTWSRQIFLFYIILCVCNISSFIRW